LTARAKAKFVPILHVPRGIEECDINVTGVDVLELRVACPGTLVLVGQFLHGLVQIEKRLWSLGSGEVYGVEFLSRQMANSCSAACGSPRSMAERIWVTSDMQLMVTNQSGVCD